MTSIGLKANRLLERFFTRPSITWQQSLSIVLPLIAEHLFNTLFGLLNTGMISSSGVTSLSAVSLVDTLNTFLFVFYTGIATGASVIVANYRGRGDEVMLHKASIQAVTSVTLFTIFTSLFIIVFNGPLLTMLFGAAEPEVMEKARIYMLGSALTLPLLGITTSLCGVLRGIGEGRTALGYTIICMAKYVLLNVIFLRILNMGIPGLILSISLSRMLNVPVLLYLIRRSHSKFYFRFGEFFHLDFKLLKSIMKVGFPCATEQLFFTGGRLVTQTIIVPMGTNSIAAYNIAYSIMSLNQTMSSSVNTAMFTISGICMGNERPEDVRSLSKSYIGLNTVLYLASFGLIMLLFNFLIGFYNAPAEVIPLIFQCVVITGIANPIFHHFAFMLPSVFRAVGDGNYCTIVSLIIMWVIRVFGGYVLGTMMGMGVMGVWIAMVLDWVARAIVFPVRFRGDKWLRHKVI